jgi:DNA-binding NarL/FixJ family response regulator
VYAEHLSSAGGADRQLPGTSDLYDEGGRVDSERGLPMVLTAREREVLKLVAEGLSNREIAERLVITERTVRFHVESLFGKIGARSRAELVHKARLMGLLDG